MRLTTTRLFPLGLMLALALITFYLERAVREDEAHPALRRHDPDYLVTNFTTTSYNPEGKPETTLSAAKMLHYPDDDSTDLVSPRVVHERPNEPRMTVSADRGTLARDGEDIFLYDNVVLVREAAAKRPEARMMTSFLHIVRDKSLVRTDREVEIIEGPRRIAGRGMQYNNDAQLLELLADVRARFDPESAR